jgi:hypothetical protein
MSTGISRFFPNDLYCRQTKSADSALVLRAVPAALTLENAAVGWAHAVA